MYINSQNIIRHKDSVRSNKVYSIVVYFYLFIYKILFKEVLRQNIKLKHPGKSFH